MSQLHHDSDPLEIFNKMENSGYGGLIPAITPQALKTMCEDDPTLLQCYEEVIQYCIRYSHDVFNMLYEQATLEELRARGDDTPEMYEEVRRIDQNRHNLHEATMASINKMSRELAKKEKDIEWMREVVSGGRASYAKFAMLTFYNIYSTMSLDEKGASS